MTEVIIRFAGRFVFACSGAGDLHVLAINPAAKEGIRSQPHSLLFTAPHSGSRRGHEERIAASTMQELRPTYRLLTSAHSSRADHGVWNLLGSDVDINVSQHVAEYGSGFSWNKGDSSVLADLGERGGRPFNRSTLTPVGVNSNLITSVIHLPAGTGAPRQVVANKLRYHFERFNAPGTPVGEPMQLADLVEVTLSVNDALQMAVTPRESGLAGIISVDADSVQPTIVNFTNLCTTSHVGPDQEFAALYDVLLEAPELEDRLIPKVDRPTLFEVPFGDCYPGGLVNY